MTTSDDRPKFVLLTGGTGYIGHRVLDELLKAGYRVRATSRPPKVPVLKSCFPNAGDKLEVVVISDLVEVKWEDLLQDIDAVIHVAAPVFRPGVGSKEIYDAAIIGTKRLLESVCQSKTVKRFVFTNSVGAFFKPDWSNVFQDVTFDETTWSDVEDIDPSTAPPDATYLASKAIAEKLVWKTADKRPDIDFSVVFPPCVYGKFLDAYTRPMDEGDFNANMFLYWLIKDKAPFPPFPAIAQANLHDVARIHVLALTSKKLENGRKKRLIITSGNMPWDQAVEYLRKKRPELKDRLPDVAKASLPPHYFKLDTKLTKEVVGVAQESMISWQDTLLEVMDWVADWEKKNAS